MGWKKLVVIIGCCCMFFSCKNYFYNTEGGIRPKKNNFNFATSEYILNKPNLIDTNSVYVNEVNLNYDNKMDRYKRFYRFFTNGRVVEGTSGLYNNDLNTSRLNDFNNSSVIVGYYKINDENILFIESFRVKKYEGGAYSKTFGFIRNDSIFIVKNGNLNSKFNSLKTSEFDIYKREKVEGLTGTPDW